MNAVDVSFSRPKRVTFRFCATNRTTRRRFTRGGPVRAIVLRIVLRLKMRNWDEISGVIARPPSLAYPRSARQSSFVPSRFSSRNLLRRSCEQLAYLAAKFREEETETSLVWTTKILRLPDECTKSSKLLLLDKCFVQILKSVRKKKQDLALRSSMGEFKRGFLGKFGVSI